MNELNKIIAGEIQASGGTISFARFMELALYTPELGYYEQPGRTPGRNGDFYTSVSVGSVFGELLACQFATWLDAMHSCLPDVPPLAGLASSMPSNDHPLRAQGSGERAEVRCAISPLAPLPSGLASVPRPFLLLETGAHDGRLAMDILGWFHQWRPDLLAEITYGILEPSATRQAWQHERLAALFPTVQWWKSWSEVPTPVNGIVFSNELLDAFPVHRLHWHAESNRWSELGVANRGAGVPPAPLAANFIWTDIQPSPTVTALLPEIPLELQAVLPDGYQIEVSPAAVNWWQTAARSLANGVLMSIDYGFTEDQWLLPGRQNGTLLSYAQHKVTDDLLADPGAQDLTAHVNFSSLIRAGEQAGLATEPMRSQSDFLTHIVRQIEAAQIPFPAWTPPRLRQFQTLIHPEHLGRPFRVLVQTKA